MIIILGFICLSLINLSAKPFWIDESIMVMPAANILKAGVPLADFECDFFPWQIKNNIWDPATPLYRYALSVFIKLFGFSEFSARLFSVAFGILVIWICYLFFKDMYGGEIALISAALISSSAVFIKFEREARYFTFLMFLVVVTLYFLYKAVNSADRRGRFIWPLFMLATVLSHYVGFLIIPLVLGYLIINRTRLYFQKRDYILFLILAVIYLPIFTAFWDSLPVFHKVDGSNHIAGYNPSVFYYPEIGYSIISHILSKDAELMSFKDIGFNFSFNLLFFIFGFIIMAGNLIRRKDTSDREKLIILWFFVPLFFLSMKEVKFPRYIVVYAVPVYFLIISQAVYYISTVSSKKYRDYLMMYLVGMVIFSPQLNIYPGKHYDVDNSTRIKFSQLSFIRNHILYPKRENYEKINLQYAFLKDKVKDKDIVISTLNDITLSFYLKRKVYGFLNSKNSDKFLLTLLHQGRRIWFIDELAIGNWCITDDKEPAWVDCREKYNRFYKSICSQGIVEKSFEGGKIYLYDIDKNNETIAKH